jgi:uncharacterized membrane protein
MTGRVVRMADGASRAAGSGSGPGSGSGSEPAAGSAAASAPRERPSGPGEGVRPGPSVWAGVLIGVGIAAFIDETVFHQLLHWHHFYDKSTPDAGLVSDGLFHAFGWFAVVIGLVRVADLRRRPALTGRGLLGGVFLGAGFFQLYDGTVQHKILKLHQIRYHVDLVAYDWTWNVLAVVLLLVGAVLVRVSTRRLRTSGNGPTNSGQSSTS